MIHASRTSATAAGGFLDPSTRRGRAEKFFESQCSLRSLRLIITGSADMNLQPTILVVDDEKP
jgi:hypothetical protein